MPKETRVFKNMVSYLKKIKKGKVDFFWKQIACLVMEVLLSSKLTDGNELIKLNDRLTEDQLASSDEFIKELVKCVPSNGGEQAFALLRLIEHLVNKEYVFIK
jgi:hypothetical protein